MSIFGQKVIKNVKKVDILSYLKQEYRFLFQHFPGACIVCDREGLILETNDNFDMLIDTSKANQGNKSIYDFIHFEQANKELPDLDSLKIGKTVIINTEIITNANGVRSMEATLIPVNIQGTFYGMFVVLLDITEKKELEKSLDIWKENVKYGQQLTNIGSWTHDIQKDEIFLSDGIYSILGCSPTEFDGKLEKFYLYVHPNDLKAVKEATQGALSGKEYDIEYRIITKDGSVRYLHERTIFLLDEYNNPHKIIGTVQDITRHKLVEYDLKAIGENLNQAQKVAGVGSWKYDGENDRIYWSEEVYNIFGMDPQDTKKDFLSFLELVHPEDQVKIKIAAKTCLEGENFQLEFRIPQSNSSVKYVTMKGEPFCGNGQRFIGIIGVIQDITDIKLLENKLKKNYNNLARAQRLAHIGSWEMDILQGKNYMSEEACLIYGITKDEYDGTYEGFLKRVHPDDIGMIQNILRNPLEDTFINMEFRIIRSDKAIRSVYQLMEITFDMDGKPIFINGTIQDITEKKELEDRLMYTEEAMNRLQRKYELFQQDTNDIFQIIAPEGTIQYISNNADKTFGYDSKEMIGMNMVDFFTGKEKLTFSNMLKKALSVSNKNIKGIIIFKTKLGNDVYYELNMSNLLQEPAIKGIIINWSDVSSRVSTEKKLVYVANHDEITKLPNRFYFRKRINLLCDEAKLKGNRFALFIIDIDGFKYIKDALGYQLADQLVIQIASRMKASLKGDQFLCRYSEHEFALIVTGFEHLKDYGNFAKEIIDLFINSFKVSNYELFININLGISLYPEDGHDMDTLLNHANIALTKSMEQGENKYQFHLSDMDIENYKEFELRNDLRKAIENDQIRIFFQPLVNLQTNEILSAEALIRWEHPTWGLVPPKEFLSIAEETGYIIDLGKWMLKEVCRSYKKWRDMGLPDIMVSLNYSVVQFYEKNFTDNIKSIISEFKLEPSFIIIEIIESVLFGKFEQIIIDIKKLKEMGIHIALDHFGTGFSSFEYLQQLNIDLLKIDRSFIMNIPKDETSSIITKTIVNLGKELRYKVVAEGIETWEQLLYLKNLNCFAGQGFIYSKPVPGDEFIKLLAKKNCKPMKVNDAGEVQFEERRKYFRIEFSFMLEAIMTIMEISGKKAQIGNTKVIVKNIGPGGLCFISNIRFPITRDIILQFSTQLLGKEIKVFGCPVWSADTDGNLYEYGIEFTFDENERVNVTGVLNQVQIKMKNNKGFNEGSFITTSIKQYFQPKK